MAIYLGLDSSTQSLSAIAIEVTDASRRVRFERSIAFDTGFPDYGTRHGVLPSPDPLVAASSPLMWAEALDRMMGLVATEGGFDPADVSAIAGSAQQHGSVYLNASALPTLVALDPARPLAHQIAGIFSRRESPIWMDSSTASQCQAITRALGGEEAVGTLTGSRAFERFTGPQIRKFFETAPDAYARTARIHLISSFLASLLVCGEAPTEPGDASGMNLMDLARHRWADAALDATAPDLAARLPSVVEPWTVVGPLARYWTERYGFAPAPVVVWSGDNPSSLVGVGIVDEERAAISLGTSDTRFGLMRGYRTDPAGTGHVFGAPTGDYMSLQCFRNGSLARERVRDRFGLDWRGFSRALETTPPANGGAIMLPWFEPEITPPVAVPGARHYGMPPDSGAVHVRAIIEAQMMAMARHASWMGTRPRVIVATGGASGNREILQVMADVHQAEVWRLPLGNSACLGAALRACHADRRRTRRPISWTEVVAGFAGAEAADRIRPRSDLEPRYRALADVHEACEAHALGLGPDPGERLAAWRRAFPAE